MKSLSILIIVIFFFHFGQAQSVFHKTYQFNPGYYSIASDGLIDNNGSLYIVGTYYSSSFGKTFLSKLDSDGNIYWAKLYESSSRISAVNILWNQDSTISLLAYMYNTSSMRDFVLIRLDTLGNILSNHLYMTPTIEDGKLKLTKQGKFVIGGLMRDSNNTHFDFLMELDTNGSVIYSHQYSYTTYIGSNQLAEDDLGNFYLAGYVKDTNNSLDLMMLKFDSMGNVIHSQAYDLGSYEWLGYIIYKDNKLYALGATTRATVNGPVEDAVLICLDTSISFLWGKRYYLNNYSTFLDGLYNFSNNSNLIFKLDMGFFKTDLLGNKIDNNLFAALGGSEAYQIISATNSSFYFIGKSGFPDRIYLVKTDSTMHTYCYEGSGLTYFDTVIAPVNSFNVPINKSPLNIVTVDTLTITVTTPVINDSTFCFSAVGLAEYIIESDLSPLIYPNPFTDEITVQCKGFDFIEIYNVNGQLVKSYTTQNLALLKTDLSFLIRGIYSVLFKSQYQLNYKKIIKL